MEDNEKKIAEEQQGESGKYDGNSSYIDAIKDLKSKTVDKAEYEKLEADNKRLLKALVDGEEIEGTKKEKEPKKSVEDLYEELKREGLTNLEYSQILLELREACVERNGIDCFTPSGHQISPTRQDSETADHVAEVFKSWIDDSAGESEVFQNELIRNTNDVKIR